MRHLVELSWRVKYIILGGIWVGICVIENRGYILNRVGGFIDGDELYVVGVFEYVDVLIELWIMITFISIVPLCWFQMYVYFGRGMYEDERRKLGKIGIISWFLLVMGMLGGDYIIGGVECFVGGIMSIEGSEEVEYLQALGNYVSFLERLLISLVCVSQLPILVWFMINRGLVGLNKVYVWRRWVYVVCFVIGGLISPPDVWSQLFIVIPIINLYEVWVVGLIFVRYLNSCALGQYCISDNSALGQYCISDTVL